MRPFASCIAALTAFLLIACADDDTPSGTPISSPTAVRPTASPGPPSPTWDPLVPTPLPTTTGTLVDGKWRYSPAGSTCVYVEARRTETLYRDFMMEEVVIMDSENCGGWYLFYPSTGEAFGGLDESGDDERLRLRLEDGKVVLHAANGCTWTETRRKQDHRGDLIVELDDDCGKDEWMHYNPRTGELDFLIA